VRGVGVGGGRRLEGVVRLGSEEVRPRPAQQVLPAEAAEALPRGIDIHELLGIWIEQEQRVARFLEQGQGQLGEVLVVHGSPPEGRTGTPEPRGRRNSSGGRAAKADAALRPDYCTMRSGAELLVGEWIVTSAVSGPFVAGSTGAGSVWRTAAGPSSR